MSVEPGAAVTGQPAGGAGVTAQPTVTGQPPPAGTGLAVAEPAVSCAGVTYRFGDHVAVNQVDLTIQPGETFGLLGPNGAGKTTTIRMLVTLLKPMAGRISVFGANTATQPMRVRRMIGYVPQLLSADGSLTGRENVELFARLFDVPRSGRAQRVEEALAAMGLTEPAGRLVKTYSGGMVRRLELAQALVNAPRLLVLDEPTVGLDPIARSDVWEHITRLRERAGMTVLMTTHHMEEADLYCDRVSLMHSGRVRATDSPANLKALLGPVASLDDVFRHFTGGTLDGDTAKGGIRDVRRARRTARRLG
jgi:ABC-2 type transport system ATP-binding protein